MVENTKIQWATHTFNPWVGCEKVSPACQHCYAESWSRRTGNAGLWQGQRRRTTESNWRQPLKWNEAARAAGVRARVFCASLADVFDNTVSAEWRADLVRLIRSTPHLDWLLLTKRIGNARRMLNEALVSWYGYTGLWDEAPFDNVWLGATVANQEEADRDIPKLLATPARVRFLSMEPLLGPVDLSAHLYECCGSPVVGGEYMGAQEMICCNQPTPRDLLDWVIVGGESGPGARSMVLGWAKEIVKQCRDAGVAPFVKQLGSRPTNREGEPHPQIQAKGDDMREWPEVLRVREFPRGS